MCAQLSHTVQYTEQFRRCLLDRRGNKQEMKTSFFLFKENQINTWSTKSETGWPNVKDELP